MKLSFLLLVFLLAGCVRANVVPFTQRDAKRYPPRNPAEVGVYRSERPFPKYEEMGLVTVKLDQLDLPAIYQYLRTAAAGHGADAVVDFRITSETHDEPTLVEQCEQQQACLPQTTCATDGGCTTEQVCTWSPRCSNVLQSANVTTYLGIGSMIRRIP